jgi:hypothetical protein
MRRLRFLFLILIIIFTTISYAEINICGTQEAFERFLQGEKLLRPPNGPYFIYTPHFIIHFDTTGGNACTRAFAESIAKYAECTWAKEVGGLGWAAPPPDNGGPDTRYDIYIRDLPSGWGMTYLDSPYPTPYQMGYSSYIELDNYNIPYDGILWILSHEFCHACQCRYNYNYIPWWDENIACWLSEVCCDNHNINLNNVYLQFYPNPLSDPHLGISNTTNRYHYSGFIWPRFLQQYYSITSLRLMWERHGIFPSENIFAVIDTILNYYDSDLTHALTQYSVWRYFTGTRADTINYFRESNLWPTSFVDSTQQHQGPGSGNQGTRNLYGPGGTSYIEFYTTPDYLLKNTFDFSNPTIQKIASCIGYRPLAHNKTFMMDSFDTFSVLPTLSCDTFVFVPVNTGLWGASSGYNYSSTAISSNPTPPQNPELQVCSIISPRGTISPYNTITPRSIRYNNGTSAIDST